MGKNVEEIALAAKDEASRVIQNVAAELGDVGSALTRLSALSSPAGIALAAIGLTAGGIATVGIGLGETVKQLDKLSKASGVSVENLQVFRRQIKEAGGDPETLTLALRFLNRNIAEADPLLKQLHISTHDTATAFLQLARVFEGSNDAAKKQEIAFKLLGRGAGDLVGVMPELARVFDDMKTTMLANGQVMQGPTLESARALNEEVETMTRNWEGMVIRLKSVTLPWANDMVTAFNDIWSAVAGGHDTVNEVDRKIAGVENEITEALARLHGAQKGHSATSSEFQLAQDDFDKDLSVLEARLAKLNALKAQMDPKGVGAARNKDENVGVVAPVKDPLKDVLVGDALQAAEEAAKKWAEKVKEAAGAAKMLGMTAEEAARAFDKLEKNHKGGEIFKAIRDSLQPEGPPLPAEIHKLNLALDELAVMTGKPRAEAEKLAETMLHVKRVAVEGFPISTTEQQASVEALNQKIIETAALLDVSTDKAAIFVQAIAEREKRDSAIDMRKKLGVDSAADGIVKVQEKYKELIGASGLVEESFTSAFQGMETGANKFFSELNSDTHIATALVADLWHETANSIIHELIRIASIKLALKIATSFLPVPGTSIAPNIDLGKLPLPGAPPAPPVTAPATLARTAVPAPTLPQAAATARPVPVDVRTPSPDQAAAQARVQAPPRPVPVAATIDRQFLREMDRLFARGPSITLPNLQLTHNLDRVFIDGATRIAAAFPDHIRIDPPALPAMAGQSSERTLQPQATVQQGGDTYIFPSLNVADGLAAITGPRGPLRKAYDRLAIGNAY